jgi:hypothetical protein
MQQLSRPARHWHAPPPRPLHISGHRCRCAPRRAANEDASTKGTIDLLNSLLGTASTEGEHLVLSTAAAGWRPFSGGLAGAGGAGAPGGAGADGWARCCEWPRQPLLSANSIARSPSPAPASAAPRYRSPAAGHRRRRAGAGAAAGRHAAAVVAGAGQPVRASQANIHVRVGRLRTLHKRGRHQVSEGGRGGGGLTVASRRHRAGGSRLGCCCTSPLRLSLTRRNRGAGRAGSDAHVPPAQVGRARRQGHGDRRGAGHPQGAAQGAAWRRHPCQRCQGAARAGHQGGP